MRCRQIEQIVTFRSPDDIITVIYLRESEIVCIEEKNNDKDRKVSYSYAGCCFDSR